MKIIADSLGIPPQHTFVEDQSLHTNENLRNSFKLAHQLGFKKIAIATDQYQFAYTTAFMWYTTPGAGILPLAKDSMGYYNKPLPHFSTKDAFVKDFIPLEKR